MPSRFYHCLLPVLASVISAQAARATPTPTPTPATRTVKLTWEASSSPEVVGYKVFWGTGSYNYQNVRDVRNALSTSLTLSTGTKYYLSVLGYTTTENSSFSNEVTVPASSAPW